MVTGLQGSSGTTHTEVPAENRTQCSLLEGEAAELAHIGTRIENIFGVPQDIEWAIDKDGNFHILQSRPITLTPKTRLRTSDEVVWSRGYSDDYWNDNVTPLFFNLLGDQLTYIVNMELNSIMGYRGLPKELLRLFRAHVYFNLDVLKMKVMNEIPPFLRSEDILNYFPEGCGPYGKDTVKKLPFRQGARLLAELRVAVYDPNGGMSKTASAYETWTRESFDPFLKRFDMELKRLSQSGTLSELMLLADELDRTMRGHFRLVRYGIPVHNIGMNLMLKELTRRFLGEAAARVYFPQLISGLRHKTTETNRRIIELAQLARSRETTKKLFMSQTSEQILKTLSTSRASAVTQFAYEFRRFLNDMGERGFTREPYYPRWSEAPQYVLDVIKSLVRETGRDIVKTESMAVRRRVVAEEAVRHRIKSQRLGALKWLLFSIILKNARRYIVFRENQRFNLDRWITRNRRVYLEIGRRLAEQGVIERPELIFFLYRSEIRQLIRYGRRQSSGEPIGVLASQRYREFKDNEDKTPPKFLQGLREYEDRPASSRTVLQYTGIAASEGIVRGRVRVLEHIEDIPSVCEGEILVVPRTDPGWTPVFSKIAGLITETGGVLSHGTVVSREYGIPAVTNIRNACKLFRNGDEVTLDGIRGVVSLHDTV